MSRLDMVAAFWSPNSVTEEAIAQTMDTSRTSAQIIADTIASHDN